MNQTKNRFALVYDHRNLQLKRVQMSDNFEPFPDSVQVGDLFRSQPIVALAADIDGFAHVLADECALYEQGKQRLQELQPQQTYRYYRLFRFNLVDPQFATTVDEKVAIALVGEAWTVRVLGCHDPEAVNVAAVWQSLQLQTTPAGNVLQGGPLDGAEATVTRSIDVIDTETEAYKGWQPLGTQLLTDPYLTLTVESKTA